MEANPNDEIRQKMLAYFYDRNQRATSTRGKKGSQVKISDVKRELKEHHGLSQAQVVSNLTYLLERGWVSHHVEERTFITGRGTSQPSSVDWYSISADGIDKIEGDSSAFTRKDPFAGINVTAVGSTVQVGDGNYVNARYTDLHAELDALRQGILASSALDEATKFAAVADVETAKLQLAKPEPDASVINKVWPSIAKAGAAAGLVANISAIGARLASLA
jgi:hypothetical protein